MVSQWVFVMSASMTRCASSLQPLTVWSSSHNIDFNVIMKYFLLDSITNSWSEELYSLEDLLFMNNLDDSSVLATEDGKMTLTLGEAKAAKPMQPVQKPVKMFTNQPPQESVKLFTSSRPSATSSGKKEYKVLSQKDKWYSGKFDPELLEKALNDYAEMGYQVICSTTATIQGFAGAREEMIIILERDKK